MAHDVFISYSKLDRTVADAAVAVLESRGIRCWSAPRNATLGIDWSEEIVDAIGRAAMMVLIYSANANESQQVKREVERAVNHGLPVIPFRIEDVPMSKALEYFISSPHWLDAYPSPRNSHFEQLADTIQRHISPHTGVARQAEWTSSESAVSPTPVPRRGPAVAALLLLTLAVGGARFWYFWEQAKRSANDPRGSDSSTVVATQPVEPEKRELKGPDPDPETKPIVTLADVTPLKAQVEMAWDRLKGV